MADNGPCCREERLSVRSVCWLSSALALLALNTQPVLDDCTFSVFMS